ncbi:MAG: hypothetical protein IJ100_03695, partial [Lachnospiraceae bacterium]|nr:hypothetical protein [Lachnospiraceae bacterium]
ILICRDMVLILMAFWQMVCEIGSGAYGIVYIIRREDESGAYFVVLKLIIISAGDEPITM